MTDQSELAAAVGKSAGIDRGASTAAVAAPLATDPVDAGVGVNILTDLNVQSAGSHILGRRAGQADRLHLAPEDAHDNACHDHGHQDDQRRLKQDSAPVDMLRVMAHIYRLAVLRIAQIALADVQIVVEPVVPIVAAEVILELLRHPLFAVVGKGVSS